MLHVLNRQMFGSLRNICSNLYIYKLQLSVKEIIHSLSLPPEVPDINWWMRSRVFWGGIEILLPLLSYIVWITVTCVLQTFYTTCVILDFPSLVNNSFSWFLLSYFFVLSVSRNIPIMWHMFFMFFFSEVMLLLTVYFMFLWSLLTLRLICVLHNLFLSSEKEIASYLRHCTSKNVVLFLS